ncbi:MAG: saccharopine dehydrogenase NADP-binding domain-containing protein [Deltaproteobacteria bacterium]|nr:saccharopine dehydrogenase NADP-binding domain-containing protein [Deltaproteobacteria bacterium]
MRNVIVLGGGLVGSVIAEDLAREADLQVTVVDVDEAVLGVVSKRSGQRIRTVQSDLVDQANVVSCCKQADVVIDAVPGWLGFRVLSTLISEKKSFVDIAFMPEDAGRLSKAAADAGVLGVVDCGVAPGMSNVLSARGVADLEKAEELRIYVGGLPQVRRWPYEYTAVFSPIDVLEEYTRPARLVENGKVVTRPALSEVEHLDFEGVGTLEAFNSDGLRSLISLPVPDMKEKTMRYPGHTELMRAIRETGLLSYEPLKVGDVELRPIDLTCKLLKRAWKLPEGEGDITVMRVKITGMSQGKRVSHVYDLLDRYDPATGHTSMARTTGFPCAIVARMMLQGTLDLPAGVHFPEKLATNRKVLDALLVQLAERNVVFHHRIVAEPAA